MNPLTMNELLCFWRTISTHSQLESYFMDVSSSLAMEALVDKGLVKHM